MNKHILGHKNTNTISRITEFNEVAMFVFLAFFQVFLCKKFQITLFGILSGYNMAKLEGILNELYRMEDNLEIDYILLPSTTTHPIPFTICLSSSQDGCNNHVANVITKAGQVCSCELENSLVHTPDDDIFYIITGKMELDGNSLLRYSKSMIQKIL